MSIPKEPRQIMINLMYLVLTAMLALNVSHEILNAFKTINESIVKSNQNIVGNNAQMYQSLDVLEQQREQHDRVKPYNDKAKEVKAQADAMVAYLEGLQKKITTAAGGVNPKTGHIEKEDNIDIATTMFVEGEPHSKQGGDELKKKLLDFRSFIMSKITPDDQRDLEKQLPLNVVNPPKTEDNPQGDWATANFYHMPTVAAVTLFSKYINDVRNSEAMVVQKLMNESDVSVIKFDEIGAIATPKTSYALKGQKIEADIVLAAYNRTIQPAVSIQGGGGRITKVEGGVAHWEAEANGTGQQTVKGTLSIMFNGVLKSKPWEFKYVVGSEGGAIQLDKMNVFYIGLDNPVSTSAAGYSMEDTKLILPAGATATQTSLGHYNVRVTQPGNIVATVMATTQGGTQKKIAELPIRVKFMPDPIAEVGGKHGGLMQAQAFAAQQGIAAELKDFLFEGVRFHVTKYTFSMKRKRDPDVTSPVTVPGELFTGTVSTMIKAVRTGDKVFFDDIWAAGPDNKPRNLGTLTFTML